MEINSNCARPQILFEIITVFRVLVSLYLLFTFRLELYICKKDDDDIPCIKKVGFVMEWNCTQQKSNAYTAYGYTDLSN